MNRARTVLAVYALAWLLPAFVAGYALRTMFEFNTLPVPDYSPAVHSGFARFLLDPWQHWDGQWYLRIAALGYYPDDASAAFLPVYPNAIRALAALVQGDGLFAACLISWVALALALWILSKLVSDEIGEENAALTLVLLVTFPTAFFFHAAYTESLFLLLCAIALVSARRGRFWVAGAAALAATLTRWTGFALVPALLIEAWSQAYERTVPATDAPLTSEKLVAKEGWRSLRGIAPLAVLFAVLPLAALPIVNRVLDHAIHDPWGFNRAQRLWERRLAPPWTGLIDGIRVLLPGHPPYLSPLPGGFPRLVEYPGGFLDAHAYNLIAAAFGLYLAYLALRRLRPMYAIFALASVVLPLMTPSRLQPLQSMPRFLVVAFPLFMALALSLRSRPLLTACVIAIFATLQGFFTARFTLWFWVA